MTWGRVCHWHADHADEHTARIDGWRLRYDQLDGGRFAASFCDLRLPGVQVFRERTSRRLRQSGRLTPGSVGLAFMRSGAGEQLLRSSADEVDVCTPPDCELLGVVADGALLPAQRPGPAARPGADALAELRRRLDRACALAAEPRALAEGSATWRALRASLIGVLGDVFTTPVDDAGHDDGAGRAEQRRRGLVGEATRLLLLAPADAPVRDVCRRIGVGARTLNAAFHAVVGSGPRAHVRALRLNGARRDLERGRGVGDAAAAWGFWHLGRFAAAYREQFDELPSQTQRRAAARTP